MQDFRAVVKENKLFLENWAFYLSALRMNRWVITEDVIKEVVEQWEDHNHREMPIELFCCVAMLFFPYTKSSIK